MDFNELVKVLEERKQLMSELVAERIKQCICGGCPTYNDCSRKAGQGLFCILGDTACIKDRKNCICGDCQVYKDLGFKFGYYCILDTEKKQRGL